MRWRHAYCLMTNHYHLLVETLDPNIGRGMERLNGIYARWFNWRHGYAGHLFERRYHDELVERDAQLFELAARRHYAEFHSGDRRALTSAVFDRSRCLAAGHGCLAESVHACEPLGEEADEQRAR